MLRTLQSVPKRPSRTCSHAEQRPAGRSSRPQAMRILLILAGLTTMAIGLIGVVVPLLPTTPFLLLSAACLARGAPRCHGWLLRLPVAGPALADYEAGRGVSRSTRRRALIVLWAGMAVSIAAVGASWPLSAALVIVGMAVSPVIARLPGRSSPAPPQTTTARTSRT